MALAELVSTDPGSNFYGAGAMRIATVDFDIMGGDFKVQDLGSIVAEWMIASFVQSGRFEDVFPP